MKMFYNLPMDELSGFIMHLLHIRVTWQNEETHRSNAAAVANPLPNMPS